MGRLGYSSITLTDLTETIPVSLILETNQPKNIQLKNGIEYTPDFSEDEGELIITPSLFLGQEDLHIENNPNKFVVPNGETEGFIYYQVEEVDEQGNEKKYYYGSSSESSGIWVDIEGKLHYKKNLTENLTIEAYIDKFQNEEHSYIVDLVQATNPIQMLLLDNRGNEYSLVVSSANGRQHFEDTQASPIELTASLYKGSTPIQVGLTYEWHALTDGKNEVLGTGASLSVSRDMVYSEEKFLCKVTNETTGLEYTGTIDIWDQVDKYTCVISSDYPLILSENFSGVTLTASVFDEKGELI